MIVQLNNLLSPVHLGIHIGIVSHVTNCTLEYQIDLILAIDFCTLFIPAHSKVKTRVIFLNSIATQGLRKQGGRGAIVLPLLLKMEQN